MRFLLLIMCIWGSMVTCNSSNNLLMLETESMGPPLKVIEENVASESEQFVSTTLQESLLFIILGNLASDQFREYPILGTALRKALATVLMTRVSDVGNLYVKDVDVVGEASSSVNVAILTHYDSSTCEKLLMRSSATFIGNFSFNAAQAGYTGSLSKVQLTSVYSSTLAPTPNPTVNPTPRPSAQPSMNPTPFPTGCWCIIFIVSVYKFGLFATTNMYICIHHMYQKLHLIRISHAASNTSSHCTAYNRSNSCALGSILDIIQSFSLHHLSLGRGSSWEWHIAGNNR